ncbi:hypothetical protein NUW58_g3170 [Xylaria curta]|uniref:Uncharacterized protein n=1 Tax=Xylaria curta TaxID=42375 RepID=A0ACC1PDE2_9PEZI|nr:hypothetical protein NUW58_g3170 [Xylaria curta]
MRGNRDKLVAQRERLIRELPKIKGVGRLRGGVESNFLLYELLNKDGQPDNVTALAVYETLAENKGVVVRFRGALERTLAEVNDHGTTASKDEEKKEIEANAVIS